MFGGGITIGPVCAPFVLSLGGIEKGSGACGSFGKVMHVSGSSELDVKCCAAF